MEGFFLFKICTISCSNVKIHKDVQKATGNRITGGREGKTMVNLFLEISTVRDTHNLCWAGSVEFYNWDKNYLTELVLFWKCKGSVTDD